MIEQCKGKDLAKVPNSKLENAFIASIKYDGHYVQIKKYQGQIHFYTSGGKEFYIEHIADELINLNPDIDFIIEAEYIADTTGKLGNRGKAARLTTYRTNFEKNLDSGAIPGKDIFKVFDCIAFKNYKTQDGYCPKDAAITFNNRINYLNSINLGTHLERVIFSSVMSLAQCQEKAKDVVKQGFEGLYLKSPEHRYYPGKRVNDAIKLKLRPTADLLCIDLEEGTGKYTGMIGALVLQDKSGRIVKVGSGLSDADRAKNPQNFLNNIIEIEYEQIIDTYIQPTYIQRRLDKTVKEID